MKVIIFGIGNYYNEQKQKLLSISNLEIVSYTDNNSLLWDQTLDNIPIISPNLIGTVEYEKIIIMSIYVRDIFNQLVEMEIDTSMIIIWEQYWAGFLQGKKKIYSKEIVSETVGGDVLLISTYLNYNGGSLAAVYAAIALKNKEHQVVLAAPGGNEKFIDEVIKSGIIIVICPALPYLFEKEKQWIQQFDVIIVNVLQMIQCACEIKKIKPTLWWIHESSVLYGQVMMKYPNCIERKKMQKLNIYAVSEKARDNFNRIFFDKVDGILPYGIPDISEVGEVSVVKESMVVFAIIGEVCRLKAQDIFLKAAFKVKPNHRQVKFWIIGKLRNDNYCDEIRKLASDMKSVKILGELTREEIYKLFPQIDVIVCASHEDSLPIVITEAMMFGKVSITTNGTGSADYIQDGINGFIVPSNNILALQEKMEWIINHYENIGKIGRCARETYENHFSMDIFGRNLEKKLEETKEKWIRY